jgi:calreticulin
MKAVVGVLAVLVLAASAEVFFAEKFGEGWENRWVQSKAKGDLGKFVSSAGKYFNDAKEDAGIKTSQDARFYGLTAKYDKFSNKGKTLVVQFVVKHEQDLDCGGGYVKIFPSTQEPEGMNGDSPYNIMFGPDICGPGHRKVHVIFSHAGTNHLVKKTITCKSDTLSHLYTLIVNPDNTYEVRIDDDKVESGSLYEDWDMLPAKEINDPSQSKPVDWVDAKTIPDPEDKKPADWDKPETVADPNATKPDDWDDDMDGEWEAPQIPNPDFKGEWKPKMIPNPAYKGEWVHPKIANPDYVHDDALYAYEDFGAIGFDLWQVKSGTIFDDVLLTDDLAVQKQWADSFKTRAAGEKKAKEDADAAEKAAAEAAKASQADNEEEEEADEDEDEDEAPNKKDEL